MRKVVVSEFISLDGVIGAPQWTFDFATEEQDKYKYAEMEASDALLIGRVTYESFASTWPNLVEETGQYGLWMNGNRKHVVTTTLDKAEWTNSSIINENVVEEINNLKQQPGKDILVFGSSVLIKTLMQNDLIDEYRLMMFPIVIGSGQKLFSDNIDTKKLKLVDTKTFPTGVIVLTYQPASQ